MKNRALALSFVLFCQLAIADVGDPQVRTDHPWYPGELAISTFERLFATQAAAYERATGNRVDSDEQKALAAWFWRNTHFWHGEAGGRDLWGQGLNQGKDRRLREYWNGMFGYGFGLCGTTHSQWTAEFEHLLGHGRGRGVGVAGHNAFEVFLQGGAYGPTGSWALLDHDLSTVIFDDSGRRLLGLGEIQNGVERWIDRGYKPDRQRGWLVCGLHPADGASYRKYAVAEYLAGYAGPPPMVHLRRGERMRRYFEPGLDNGKTFVFWGRNYRTDGIPGPERSRTWVNQPESMHGSKNGTAHRNGQARYANVEYVYHPEPRALKNAVIKFQTPYVIAATPPNDQPWGIYDAGCRNGLVLNGSSNGTVEISLDAGRSWVPGGKMINGLDLTDIVKGRSQYWLRFSGGTPVGLVIRTVCQANVAVLPRLKDQGTTIRYEASGKSVLSLGPELELAKTFVTSGAFGEKAVTLTVTPENPAVGLHVTAHVASGSPPDPSVRYQIEYSLNGGVTWLSLVKDWTIPRRGDEPGDHWSQSFCYGFSEIVAEADEPILIRFHNDGGKRYLRAEAHLIQEVGKPDPVKVTYDWNDAKGRQRKSHVFDSKGAWRLSTGRNVRTRWVEFEPVAR
jgi:hypothetical protein